MVTGDKALYPISLPCMRLAVARYPSGGAVTAIGGAGGGLGDWVPAVLRMEVRMGRRDHKIETLSKLALFSSCDDRELAAVAKLVDEADVPAGHMLIEEGSPSCREAFIILEGQASVTVRDVQVAIVGPGSFT